MWCPARLAKPHRVACAFLFTEGEPAPAHHDPSRGYTPLEKPWNGEQAGENCHFDLELDK